MTDPTAARIKSARTTAGLSREQLAGVLGISLSTVVRWEAGRTKRISLEQLVMIARATGQPLGFFIAEEVPAA